MLRVYLHSISQLRGSVLRSILFYLLSSAIVSVFAMMVKFRWQGVQRR